MKRIILISLAFLVAIGSTAYAEVSSDVVSHGEYGQVSTIAGNGTAGQGTYTMDHPRYPAPDSKGNVYFIDGSQKTAKLRMWNGSKATTIVDLRKNTVTKREGEFYATGLQIVNRSMFLSSNNKVYKVLGSRMSEIPSITRYMKDEKYKYIYRMEQYDGDLILMLWRKNWTYAFVRYHISDDSMEEILPAAAYPSPTNFFMQDRGISISTEFGNVWYEKFFPRKSVDQIDTNTGKILDTWITENGVYFVLLKDQTQVLIYMVPLNTVDDTGDDLVLIAGGPIGFYDGTADEVQMDGATDFVWDGSGYIFADEGSNALRKLWLDEKPL